MMEKIIGIIGGVGPLAGVDLHNKIIKNTHTSTDQNHLPVIHISMSPFIADRTEYILDTSHQNPAKALFNVVCTLYNAGARVMGIPCNSAHAPIIFNKLVSLLQKKTPSLYNDILLINMIEAVGTYILENTLQTDKKIIGLLSTNGTYTSGVYKKILEPHKISILYPKTKHAQNQVHNSIYDPTRGIKACSSPIQKYAKDILIHQAEALIRSGASHIILGCTEIPLAINNTDIRVPIIDPTNILARALVKHSCPNKLNYVQ